MHCRCLIPSVFTSHRIWVVHPTHLPFLPLLLNQQQAILHKRTQYLLHENTQEKESTTKPSRTKKQPWLNREMNKSLTRNSGENKERLFSNYTFILNGEVLGWEPAGELPQSAEWKTASVTCFQIRHHKADSSPRPWETTLTKIYTGDLLRKVCMGKAFGRQERIRSFPEKCLLVL